MLRALSVSLLRLSPRPLATDPCAMHTWSGMQFSSRRPRPLTPCPVPQSTGLRWLRSVAAHPPLS